MWFGHGWHGASTGWIEFMRLSWLSSSHSVTCHLFCGPKASWICMTYVSSSVQEQQSTKTSDCWLRLGGKYPQIIPFSRCAVPSLIPGRTSSPLSYNSEDSSDSSTSQSHILLLLQTLLYDSQSGLFCIPPFSGQFSTWLS